MSTSMDTPYLITMATLPDHNAADGWRRAYAALDNLDDLRCL